MGKRTKWKKALSLLLVLSMMFSLFSINAFAAEPEDADYVPEEPAVEEVVTETEETEPEVPEVPEQPEEPEVTEPETPEVPAETEGTEPEVPAGTEETEPEVPAETEGTEPEVPAETEDETAEPEESAEAEEAGEAEDADAEDEPADEELSEEELMAFLEGLSDEELMAYLEGLSDEELAALLENMGISVFAPAKPSCSHGNWTKYESKNNGTHLATCGKCGKDVSQNCDKTLIWEPAREFSFDETWVMIEKCALCGYETGNTRKVEPVVQVGNMVYGSLQEALNAAKESYYNAKGKQTEWTVRLLRDITECVNLTVVPTNANKMDLIIDLNGYTLTGTGAGPVISIGKSSGYSAQITFIIDDSSKGSGVVTGGNAAKGGAVYISDSSSGQKLIIKGGTFRGNTATQGGAIWSSYQGDVPVEIYGGTFIGNTAEQGGAVYARTLTVNGGTFTGNHANVGGAINVVNGYKGSLTISGGSIHDNTADAYGDDIAVGQTDSMDRYKTSLSLMAASSMGIDDIDAWLVDGWGLNGKTDRVSDDNRVVFNVDQWPNKDGRVLVGLKAGLGHTHTAGEAVEENRVEATYEAPGSYDLVTKCEICDKEMSRETVEIAQLVPAPVTPVVPTNPGSGSSAAGSTTTPAPAETPADNDNNDAPAAPAAPTTPEDPEPEDDDDAIEEQDIPMAAPEATPEAAPEAAEEEPVTIDEEDTPLATIGESNVAAWSLLNLVLALVTVLMGLMMLASYFKAKSNLNLVSIIPAVFAVVTFVATSNLGGSMMFADPWTPAMLLYAALNAGVVAFAMKKRKESAK